MEESPGRQRSDNESCPSDQCDSPPAIHLTEEVELNNNVANSSAFESIGNCIAPCETQSSHRKTSFQAHNEDIKPTKAIEDYYRKQREHLESIKSDSELIQSSQRAREQSRRASLAASTSTKEVPSVFRHYSFSEGLQSVAKDAICAHTCKKLQSLTFSGAMANLAEPPLKCLVVRDESNTASIHSHNQEDGHTALNKSRSAASRFASITLFVNVMIMLAKAVASYLSGSLAIISALVESAVDITSGLVIFLTSRAIKKRDLYSFPRGRTRLEPLALIIISVVMGIASIQLLMQSLHAIFEDIHHRPANCSAIRPYHMEPGLLEFCHSTDGLIDPHVDAISIGIMAATVVVKFTLMLICRRFKNDPSVSLLAQDNRNDSISNFVALACAILATQLWIYLDPIGAVLVSIYIARSWYRTGMEHGRMLTGKTADPDFINRIIKICVDHDARIRFIHNVYVYHFGTRFLVEVDVVLDKDMPLHLAHDISEGLQIKIESLEEVERAFVHADYECEHQPEDEHKIV